MKRAVFVALFVLWASPSFGQYRVQFSPSPDHALQEHGVNIVDRYELVVQPAAGGTATTVNLQKPAPVSNLITVDVNSSLTPLAAGNYNFRVRAVGPGGQAETPAVPFALSPRAPNAFPATPAPTLGRPASTSAAPAAMKPSSSSKSGTAPVER